MKRWQIPDSDTGQSTDSGSKDGRRGGVNKPGGGGRMHHVSERDEPTPKVVAQSVVFVFGLIYLSKRGVLSLLSFSCTSWARAGGPRHKVLKNLINFVCMLFCQTALSPPNVLRSLRHR